MLELMDSLPDWLLAHGNRPCVIATIIGVDGSVPRPLGTSMLVSAGGEVLGSLSGGCVEGAVIEAALDSMDSGGQRHEHFGYSAADAFAAGLTCGGTLEVHIQTYDGPTLASLAAGLTGARGTEGGFPALIRRLDDDDGGGRAVVVRRPQAISEQDLCLELAGLLGAGAMARKAAVQLRQMLRGGQIGLVRLAPEAGECTDKSPTLLVESRLPPARMLIFGANDFSAALLPAAQLLGYHVTLCDARAVFARQERFGAAEQVVVAWPHRYLRAEADAGRIDDRTVVCVLSHDPKFDVPLLAAALELELAYLGAMGSRRSHRQRVDVLLEGGADPEKVARMHAPIGLDLGAVTPAEVAVSIAAEIVAGRRGTAKERSPGARSPGACSGGEAVGGAGGAGIRSSGTGTRSAGAGTRSAGAGTRSAADSVIHSLRDGTGAIHHDTSLPDTSLPDAFVPGAVISA